MFTGIVEELGRVRTFMTARTGARVEIECEAVLADAAIGASIAVNGCCLTVVELGRSAWAAHAQQETLDRTTLGSLRAGDPVNLERPLQLSSRLGGHLVQGHVDDIGTVTGRDELPDGSTLMRISASTDLLRYCVQKGSITVDGASLTITYVTDPDASDGAFAVALIPHTLEVTTLGVRQPGDRVNLEVDLLAKYVERLLGDRSRVPLQPFGVASPSRTAAEAKRA